MELGGPGRMTPYQNRPGGVLFMSVNRLNTFGLAVIALACRGSAQAPQAPQPPTAPHDPPPGTLPSASVLIDERRGEMVIALPAVELPAASPGDEVMVRTPVYRVEIPLNASLYRARVEVLDDAGRELPRELLHHFNLSDPDHR